jgi:hypothetical protein
VTAVLDKEESRDVRIGNGLGTGLTGCDGGIDEQPREERLFANMSPPISGKTEDMRELDLAGASPLSNADRPRQVGTPVRVERAVHCECRAEIHLHSVNFEFTQLPPSPCGDTFV